MSEPDRNRWTVGVVVPARNEQSRIARCLGSLLKALAFAPVRRSLVVVVADRCRDDTVPIARTVLGDNGLVFEVDFAAPGTARRFGVERVLERLPEVLHSKLWLANTDADSHVPIDWIARQLAMADDGVTAVAGIVRIDSFSSHGVNGADIFARHYRVGDDGTHSHVHGANLGIRADVYLDAGGWRDLAVGEDHCLWSRIRNRGWRAHATTASVVTTSGRLRGRAHGGFADTLRAQLRSASGEIRQQAVPVHP